MRQLDERIDLTITAEGVRQAEREASEARELAAEVKRAVVEEPPGKRPDAAEVAEKMQLAEFARRRVAVTRERAGQARQARRLLALDQPGTGIDELAAGAVSREAGDSIAQAVQKIAQAAGVLRELCGQHDRAVGRIVGRQHT